VSFSVQITNTNIQSNNQTRRIKKTLKPILKIWIMHYLLHTFKEVCRPTTWNPRYIYNKSSEAHSTTRINIYLHVKTNLHCYSGVTATLWFIVWFVEYKTNLSLTLQGWNTYKSQYWWQCNPLCTVQTFNSSHAASFCAMYGCKYILWYSEFRTPQTWETV
jgi:hypothetical protein